MTKEIEQLARTVCDSLIDQRGRETFVFDNHGVERFAQLVREAHTKELLAGVGEPEHWRLWNEHNRMWFYRDVPDEPNCEPLYTASQVASAVLRERERIAEYVNRNLMSSGEYFDAIREGKPK